MGFKLSDCRLLRFIEPDRFASPVLSQDPLKITGHSRKTLVVNETIEDLAILLALDNEIADSNYTVLRTKFDQLKQIAQLVKAAVNITYYNGVPLRRTSRRDLA